MPVSVAAAKVPQHLGVILDGNRRWAQDQQLPPQEIYRAGAAKVPKFLSWCEQASVPVVSLWALSRDNLQRDPQEVLPLLDVIVETLQDMSAQHSWRLRIIGRLEMLPDTVASRLHEVQEATSGELGLVANIAIAYDGRADIATAARQLLALGLPAHCDIDVLERLLAERLSTAGLPDLDLLIRTSGELRTSGFLLWQTAQAELYFTATPWPEIQESNLLQALAAYRERHRRYGK
ncbi:polyprenyl diphosphate synthase [Streptomyces pathocidini]|uniref:polyprenyl diphosphate synthase n=1 Tax=Streptomyces pathocidini TaxID=1650571 RepID=UPI0033C4EB43